MIPRYLCPVNRKETPVDQAIHLLQKGEVVALPTETVYGLAANALRSESVARIFSLKKRPFFDPLLVHVKNWDDLQKWAHHIPSEAKKLYDQLGPGPLTYLLPKNPLIPDLTTSGLATVGLRIPDHPLFIEVLNGLDFPLAAPSANLFGYISPTTAQHVKDQLGDTLPYILDGGPCRVGIESTIIDFTSGPLSIARLGGVRVDQIEEILGHSIAVASHSTSKPQAPGQLESHYAPSKPLRLIPYGERPELKEETAYLPFVRRADGTTGSFAFYFPLSDDGSDEIAAANLFKALRLADQSTALEIVAELAPAHGLGLAINDRLTRAAAKR